MLCLYLRGRKARTLRTEADISVRISCDLCEMGVKIWGCLRSHVSEAYKILIRKPYMKEPLGYKLEDDIKICSETSTL
jgi:hypothetical protein